MVAESCNEATVGPVTEEMLRREKETLQALLKAMPKGNDKEKAQAWINDADEAINRAFRLVELRNKHPELKAAFDDLDALADRADSEWFKFSLKMDPS